MGTMYGRDTFKQNVFEELDYLIDKHNVPPVQAMSQILDVISSMYLESDFTTDIMRREIFKAKEEARKEIMDKVTKNLGEN